MVAALDFVALHVDDVAETRKQLEGEGRSVRRGHVRHGRLPHAFFTDPDGNDLMLHHRYAPNR
jgi:catechol 2,3-dioxygenase-like lactoylglutathione lyase family enzyme